MTPEEYSRILSEEMARIEAAHQEMLRLRGKLNLMVWWTGLGVTISWLGVAFQVALSIFRLWRGI